MIILNFLEKILRKFGYCIVPFTEGKFYLGCDGTTYNMDLSKPVGNKIRSSHPTTSQYHYFECQKVIDITACQYGRLMAARSPIPGWVWGGYECLRDNERYSKRARIINNNSA